MLRVKNASLCDMCVGCLRLLVAAAVLVLSRAERARRRVFRLRDTGVVGELLASARCAARSLLVRRGADLRIPERRDYRV